MAKGIYNRPYIQGATQLGKRLIIKHIKECLDVEGYTNGSRKVLKMGKSQEGFLRGIYKALDLLSNIWIALKKQGCEGVLITSLLEDDFFADYIVDRYAFMQKLSPELYQQYYKEAEEDDGLIEV